MPRVAASENVGCRGFAGCNWSSGETATKTHLVFIFLHFVKVGTGRQNVGCGEQDGGPCPPQVQGPSARLLSNGVTPAKSHHLRDLQAPPGTERLMNFHSAGPAWGASEGKAKGLAPADTEQASHQTWKVS